MPDNQVATGSPAAEPVQTEGQAAQAAQQTPATPTPDNAPAQAAGAATQPVTETWEADKRWEQMWKKDHKNTYKSYREMEKQYSPIKERVDLLNSILKEAKIDDPAKIREIVKEVADLKNPERPENQVFNYLKSLTSDDPVTRQDLEKYLGELEERKLAAKYPGLTREAREKQMELEGRLKQLEDEKRQAETKRQEAEATEAINKAADEIRSYCADVKLELTAEMVEAFSKEFSTKNVPPEYGFFLFQKMFQKQIEQAIKSRNEAETLEKLNKNKTTISGATSTKPGAQGKGAERIAKIDAALGFDGNPS